MEQTVKAVLTSKFEVRLLANRGHYTIVWTRDNLTRYSEKIIGLDTAFYLFDLKLADMVGH